MFYFRNDMCQINNKCVCGVMQKDFAHKEYANANVCVYLRLFPRVSLYKYLKIFFCNKHDLCAMRYLFTYAHRLRVPKKLFVQIYSSVFFGGLQIEKKNSIFCGELNFLSLSRYYPYI